MAKATFAAGCFWGVQDAFEELEGVRATQVGYTAGRIEHPSYEQVCSGRTGHAEAVEVEYDPDALSYETLLERFFTIHDPTTLNRQGPDIGTQYRSGIYYHDEAQKAAAQAMIAALNRGRFQGRITTELAPAGTFWRGEEYHQHYFKKRGVSGGCHSY